LILSLIGSEATEKVEATITIGKLVAAINRTPQIPSSYDAR
jgi:hypothetical protein